jgi:hypothetical protein
LTSDNRREYEDQRRALDGHAVVSNAGGGRTVPLSGGRDLDLPGPANRVADEGEEAAMGTRMRSVWLTRVSAVLLVLAGVGQAGATTIATFSDPTVGQALPPAMFRVESGPGSTGGVTGGWTGTGLDLKLDPALPVAGLPLDGVFHNVRLELLNSPLTFTGTYSGGTLDPGVIRFVATDSTEILRVSFNEAYVSRTGLGSDNVFGNNGVSFAVLGQPLPLVPGTEAFAFSFANLVRFGPTPAGFTSTASFTSSGDVIPEPAGLFLAGLGTCLLFWRRR